MTKYDWKVNIENMAARVADRYGTDVVVSIFKRYDATSLYNLNPAYYDQIYGDLMLIDSDE